MNIFEKFERKYRGKAENSIFFKKKKEAGAFVQEFQRRGRRNAMLNVQRASQTRNRMQRGFANPIRKRPEARKVAERRRFANGAR